MKPDEFEANIVLDEQLKAGVIPYYFEGNNILMQFMVSSDFKFGGARPQVSKGEVESGEDLKTAAIREGHEELGLRMSNILDIGEPMSNKENKVVQSKFGRITIPTTTTIFPVKVNSRSRKDFDKPHFETKFTVWWPLNTYKDRGRKDQLKFVEYVHKYALAHK